MILIYLTIFLSSSIIAFINLSPQFGANPSKKQRELYRKYDNYNNGSNSNTKVLNPKTIQRKYLEARIIVLDDNLDKFEYVANSFEKIIPCVTRN